MGEEGTQAEPRNGKRLLKMQTLSDQQGSSTWKWRYRGVLDSEASSSLLCSGQLLRPRSIEMDGIIEGSPRQESSSYKAFPLRRVALEVPTSAKTVGKAQEAPSQVVQEEEARPAQSFGR